MENSQRSTEQGRLIYATTVLLGWYVFSSGVYAIMTGEVVAGLVWFALTAAMVAFLLRAKSVAVRENRQVPGVMWGFAVITFVLIGASSFYELLNTRIVILRSVQVPELFRNISSVIYLILLIMFIWQLIRLIRWRRQV